MVLDLSCEIVVEVAITPSCHGTEIVTRRPRQLYQP